MVRVGLLGRHRYGGGFPDESRILTDPLAVACIGAFDARVPAIIQDWQRSLSNQQQRIQELYKADFPEPLTLPKGYGDAYLSAYTAFKPCNFTALSFMSQLRKVQFKPDTSAGLYFMGKKKKDCLKPAMRGASALGHKWIKFCSAESDASEDMITEWIHNNVAPDLLFGRSQLSSTSRIKDRAVHGRPFPLILLEGLIAQPFLENVIKHKPIAFATGIDLSELGTLLSRSKHGGPYYASLDWSAFDKTVSKKELHHAFDLLESLCSFPDSQTRLIFKLTRYAFIHSRLAAPDGNLYELNGVVPSGSFFTAIVDTIVNSIRCRHLCITEQAERFDLSNLGDDSLITSTTRLSIEAIEQWQKNNFPWTTLHPDKCVVTDRFEEVTYLGHLLRGFSLSREYVRVVRLACLPERESTSPQTQEKLFQLWIDSGSRHDVIYQAHEYCARCTGLSPRYTHSPVGHSPLDVTSFILQ